MSQYRNERRAYSPAIGDEVVVHGRFVGKLLVESVDTERQTATLRNLHNDSLIRDVAWKTMLPLKHLPGLAAMADGFKDGEI